MNLTVSKTKIANLLEKKVGALLDTSKNIQQIKCEEKHHFGPGLYIKEVTMPAGSVIVGKHHKVEHLCNMISGRMIIVNPDGSRHELVAPMTFVAKPGRKVAYIIETVVFQNIYSTDETDIQKLENMFVDNSKNLLEEGN
jgi:hypothetical protein